MPVNVNKISPSKLKALKDGETISIYYASCQEEADNGASRVFVERFPRKVATTFSSVWATQLRIDAPIKPGILARPKRTQVTVVGASPDIYRMVVKWMLSCCEGKGVQQFQEATPNPFSTYFGVREVACYLGINALTQQTEYHLQRMVARQIHTNDIREMYAQWPAGHPVLTDIANHVADLLGTGKLRGYGAYKALWEAHPQFDNDLRVALSQRSALPEDGQMRKFQSLDSRQPSGAAATTAEQAQMQTQPLPPETREPADTVAESSKMSVGADTKTDPDVDPRGRGKGPSTQRPNQGRRSVAYKAPRGRSAHISPPLTDVGARGDTSRRGEDSAQTVSGNNTTSPGTTQQSRGRGQANRRGVWERKIRSTDGTDDRHDSPVADAAQHVHSTLANPNNQSGPSQLRSSSTSTSTSTTQSTTVSSLTSASGARNVYIIGSGKSSTATEESKVQPATDLHQSTTKDEAEKKATPKPKAKARTKSQSNYFAIFEDDTACHTAVDVQPSGRR